MSKRLYLIFAFEGLKTVSGFENHVWFGATYQTELETFTST